MVSYLEHVRWVVYLGAGLGAWRYALCRLPLTVVLLAAAFTCDDHRHRQYMDVLRIARPNAPLITPPPVDTAHQASTDHNLDRGSPRHSSAADLGSGSEVHHRHGPANRPVAAREGKRWKRLEWRSPWR